MGAKLFLGGVPLYPDVRRLLEKYGTPDEGMMIPYLDIAAVIGAAHGTSRWGSVVASWRRQLARPPHVRRLVAHPDVGAYRVLSADEHVTHAGRKIGNAVRAVGRQVTSVAYIAPSRLSETGRAESDLVLSRGTAVKLAAARHARLLPATLPEPVKKPD